MYFEKCDSVRAFHIMLSSGSVLPTTLHLFYPIYMESIVGSLPTPPPPVLDLCVDWLHPSSHIYLYVMYFEKCDSVRACHIMFSSGSVLPTTLHLFYPIYMDSIVGSLPKPPPPVLDLCVDWLHQSSHIYGNIDHSSKFHKFHEKKYLKNCSCLK